MLRKITTLSLLIMIGLITSACISSGADKLPLATGVLQTPPARFENLPDFNYQPHYLQMPYKDGGISMHYIDEGPKDAPVVLLLHGQGEWAYSYRNMIPVFLEAGYRVVAPDFIGFGRSDKLPNDSDYEFDDHVQWLTTFVKEMNFEQDTTAFMFDWGGYFGLRIVAEHPEFFDRIVLANTLLPRGDNGSGGAKRFKKWRAGILARPEFPMGEMVAEGVKVKLTPEVIAAYDAPFPDESYKAGPRRFPMILPIEPANKASAANLAAWEKLANYQKPVLTIFSKMFAKSRSLGPNQHLEHIPGTKGQDHALIKKAGFYIVDDASEELANRTIAFIKANQ